MRIAINEKIKRHLGHLQESKVDELDKNLIKGLYLKNKKHREERLPQVKVSDT